MDGCLGLIFKETSFLKWPMDQAVSSLEPSPVHRPLGIITPVLQIPINQISNPFVVPMGSTALLLAILLSMSPRPTTLAEMQVRVLVPSLTRARPQDLRMP